MFLLHKCYAAPQCHSRYVIAQRILCREHQGRKQNKLRFGRDAITRDGKSRRRVWMASTESALLLKTLPGLPLQQLFTELTLPRACRFSLNRYSGKYTTMLGSRATLLRGPARAGNTRYVYKATQDAYTDSTSGACRRRFWHNGIKGYDPSTPSFLHPLLLDNSAYGPRQNLSLRRSRMHQHRQQRYHQRLCQNRLRQHLLYPHRHLPSWMHLRPTRLLPFCKKVPHPAHRFLKLSTSQPTLSALFHRCN